MKKEYFYMLLLIIVSAFNQSCGNDDDITTEKGKVSFTPESLVGHWFCIYQKWDDNGHIWDSNYKMNSDYYIIFRDDFTGCTHAGREELMEWGGSRNFSWSVPDKGIIYFKEFDERWIVKSISDNELELFWEDIEDNGEWYRITCKFQKKE